MNRRLISVFFFAIVVAGVASLLLYRLLASQMKARPAVQTGKLLVAVHNLEVGSLIKDGDLQLAAWNGAAPGDAIFNMKDAMGRGVVASIYQGEPISAKRLASKGAGAGLAATIPVGKRAVALKVDEVVGLAGFVVPGTHVDVVVSATSGRMAQDDIMAKTLLQNIEVLSAGQHIARSVEGKPDDVQVVNLLVTPDQAEVLSLVSSQTRVQLVLRNPLDTQEAESHGASMAKLFGLPQVKPVAMSAPAPRVVHEAAPKLVAPTIEVYHGAKRSEESIQGGAN